MAKSIVICCDGTGNSETGVPSNVKRLYDLLPTDGAEQVRTYHRGVGTDPRQDGEGWWRYWRPHLGGLCFGEGVARDLLELYEYLIREYKDGDRVFLFGFSRGAFTVRALAGLIHVCGLLPSDRIAQAAHAVQLYEGSEARIKKERRRLRRKRAFGAGEFDHASMDPAAVAFKAAHPQPCVVHFLGLWDTVKAYGWVWPRSFPALRHNPIVGTVRHAPALDERRALFQMTGWADNHPDIKEVWFAGDHSDVGGGHEDGNSPLADASLRWMLGEATHAGLRLNPAKAQDVACIDAGTAAASRVNPKDLWLRRGFIALDCTLRVELDNHEYPPRRRPRVLWPNGARKPGDHPFRDTVFVHRTVDARRLARDRRYARERLTRRARGGDATVRIDLAAVDDLDIRWHS